MYNPSEEQLDRTRVCHNHSASDNNTSMGSHNGVTKFSMKEPNHADR